MEIQEPGHPRELLKRLFNHYKLSSSSLSKISGIPEETILKYANGDNLSLETRMDLDDHIIFLTMSMEAHEEDERIQLLISGLAQEFDISIETIGIYAKLSPEEVDNFLEDSNSLSIEKRYRLGVTVLFLHFICYTKARREL
ncbi:HTH domain-containing protein (plasmid) [Peribacillus sp. JNUCC 23]